MSSERSLQRLIPLACFVAGAAAYASLSFLQTSKAKSGKPDAVRSPLQSASASTSQPLPYPAENFIPGARDVSTPWGSLRVYEFGPEDAKRKVLLVHGITTPCVALAGIGEGLAAKGYRVMMFDYFGRGWSDAPLVDFDERLFTVMIFAALTSSPLSWTGSDGGFGLVGYSLGGGISVNFTSMFPELVKDLVVIAPAGLIRSEHSTWGTKILYSGLLPNSLVESIVKKRLSSNPNIRTTPQNASPAAKGDAPEDDVMSGEVPNSSSLLPQAFGHPIDVEAVLQWQMEHHEGFITSFISCFLNGPVNNQHERWATIARRLRQWKAANGGQGLQCGKVLAAVGSTDAVIKTWEWKEDVLKILNPDELDILSLEAGHEVPITRSKEIVEWIYQHWSTGA